MCGAPPACDARPTNRAVFPTRPLLDAGTPALPSSARQLVWIIMARSTSSKQPSFISSCLPQGNSSLPADLRLTPLDVAALLGGDREEGHPAGEMIEGLGVDETHGRPQHPGDLCVVAARMGGARRGISLWMARDAEAVQLAEQREGRALARAPADIRPHAGHGEPGA